MPTILLVDDDSFFSLSFVEGLKSYDDSFQIHTANNGEEAILILENQDIDLVISDLKMPRMDGFELLAYMSRHNFTIPVIVVTAFGTAEIEKRVSTLNAFQYLEKPLDFDIIVEKIYAGLKAKSEGVIKGIALSSFLQLVENEKKSVTLSISCHQETGILSFKNGELIHAETGSKKGEPAAIEILGWDPVEIEITHRKTFKKKTIITKLINLIFESTRLKDDTAHADPGFLENVPVSDSHCLDISYREPDESGTFIPGHFQTFPKDDAPTTGLSFSDLVTDELAEPPETDPESFPSTVSPETPDISFSDLFVKVKEEPIVSEPGAFDANKDQINRTLMSEIKEKTMNVTKLNEAIEVLKVNAGPGLLSTDIFSSRDGQSIAGYNSNPRASALFNQISNYLEQSLKESDYTELGRYYMVDLTQNKMVIVIPMGEYQWIMHIDSQKTSLGLLLNIAIPRIVAEFEEAIIG